MARLLRYFNRSINGETAVVNVLVATNGDAGAAVANGFHRIPGVRVYALYPKGKLSDIQEAQLTTLGDNVTALEVRGNFDDCQSIVREAFADEELNRHMILTSANSINVASLLPQTLFYFYAYAQLARSGRQLKHITFSVPGGNLGHLTAALVAKRMGLPYDNVIVVNNCNDIFYQYLATGEFQPRKPVSSMASALDVGNPTNMARILDLYGGDTDALRNDVTGKTYGDDDIARTIRDTRRTTDYILDPTDHAYRALADMLPGGSHRCVPRHFASGQVQGNCRGYNRRQDHRSPEADQHGPQTKECGKNLSIAISAEKASARLNQLTVKIIQQQS